MTTFIGWIPHPDDQPHEQCPRSDLLQRDGLSCVVQCTLPVGHEGKHAFLHEWSELRPLEDGTT